MTDKTNTSGSSNTEQNVLNSILLNRNFAGGENQGSFKQEVIYPEEDFDAVLLDLKSDDQSFERYVTLGLRLLRSGAARIRISPSSASKTRVRVIQFFVGACFDKIQARFNVLREMYPFDALRGWGPLEGEEIPSLDVKISNLAVQTLLAEAKLSDNLFRFDSSNAAVWWNRLILLLLQMASHAKARKGDENINDVAAASETLHAFLRVIPSVFWSIPSLMALLCNCRSSELQTEDEEEAEAFAEADESSIFNVMPEVRAFYRGLHAVCAWTTGAKYIMSSAIGKSKAPLSLSIVDVPREDVPVHSPEALAARWTKQGHFPPSIHRKIAEKLSSFREDAQRKEADARRWAALATAMTQDAAEMVDPATTEDPTETVTGACHCEAGLIASIYLRQQDLQLDEPAVLTDAFAEFDAANPTIGVAKKCCPTCKILIDVLRTKNHLKVDIAGAHSRFSTWVPPTWLPVEVLDQLEQRLLKVVEKIIMANSHVLRGSCASSLVSDRSGSGEDDFAAEYAIHLSDLIGYIVEDGLGKEGAVTAEGQ
ncbi:hypothetical protein K438DRAFT_1954970 [Mycena galopus ATCC 62051]|nr:hypothetical protein K438DRAFT_1954970 [Mycena galopus ATCC 62051]